MVISSVHNFDKLREKTLSQTYHFKGRIINLRVDDVELSDGSTSIREIIEHPGGVCVAAENHAVPPAHRASPFLPFFG